MDTLARGRGERRLNVVLSALGREVEATVGHRDKRSATGGGGPRGDLPCWDLRAEEGALEKSRWGGCSNSRKRVLGAEGAWRFEDLWRVGRLALLC